jgi:hypothetical protein
MASTTTARSKKPFIQELSSVSYEVDAKTAALKQMNKKRRPPMPNTFE